MEGLRNHVLTKLETVDSEWTKIGALVLLASYTVYYIYAGLTGPLAHLPGPWWSKFTSLPVIYHVYHGSRIYLLHDLHKKYGPIIRATPNEVSVADPKAAAEIHKVRSEYIKTQFYEDFSPDGLEIQNVFSTADPIYHTKWRRLLASSVSQSNLMTFRPLIRKYVDKLLAQIEREKKEQGHVDLIKWFRCFTADITGEMSVGRSFETLEVGRETQFISDVNRLLVLNILRLALWPGDFAQTRILPFFPFSTLRGVSERLNQAAKGYIDEYRARVGVGAAGSSAGDGKSTLLIEKALATAASQDDVERAESGLTEAQIVTNAVILLIAGTDTTANALAYMVWLLLKNPDIKQRLIQEYKDAGLPQDPSLSDLAKLKYMDCFMLETLRLYGPAPGPLPRKVPNGGRELCGHFIPGGSTVSPVSYSISRDPDVYPNPEVFDPDRWAEGRVTPAMKGSDFSFGGGTRICIGMHIANLEMKMVLLAMLQSPSLLGVEEGSDGGAKLAYGVNGFEEEGMVMFEAISGRPRGNQVLIR